MSPLSVSKLIGLMKEFEITSHYAISYFLPTTNVDASSELSFKPVIASGK